MAFGLERSVGEAVINTGANDALFVDETLPPPPAPFHTLGAAAEPSSDFSASGVEDFSGGYEGVSLGVPAWQVQDGGWAPLWQMVDGQVVVKGAQLGGYFASVSDSALLLGNHGQDQTHNSQSDGCVHCEWP